MIPVYRAGWQLIKVRAVMALSLASAAVCLWWGLDLAQNFGLGEGDGGDLAPLPLRLVVGGLVASLGIAFVAGMWLYGSLYAAKIEFNPEMEHIHLDTVRFFWNRHHILHIKNFGRGRSHQGTNWTMVAAAAAAGHPVVLVNAPWSSVRIAGWRLPLIIDRQGVVLHPRLMRKLFVR